MKFISMHSLGNDPVDCRLLQIDFRFSRATHFQVKEMAKYCVFGIEELLEDAFLLHWRCGNKRCKNTKSLIKMIEKADNIFQYGFLGNECNSGISDFEALKLYDRKLSHQLMFSKEDITTVSEDYWDTYYKLFSNNPDAEEIKQNLLCLFRKEDVFFKKRWFGVDVTGGFYAMAYNNRSEFMHGHFDLRIALPCLGTDAVHFSEKAVFFLSRAINIISDINGHVLLGPNRDPAYCTSHMNYFGGPIKHCPLFKESYMNEHEWSQLYFLRGVEWYNLLSPLQSARLTGRSVPQGVLVTPTPNGGCSVSVNKSIIYTQVSDLYGIKQYVYPLLYPGGREIPINYLLDPSSISFMVKPRCQWENVVIFDHEIEAFPDKIVIGYQSDQGITQTYF